MIPNLMLVLAGGLLLWVEVRGLLVGRMQYKSFATERATSPVSFWLQATFYAVLGLGLVWTGIRALIRG